ncbi:hypothetical protein TrVE_jg4850 [Triparma verrucosa]|uniref:GTP-binding protein n=1 Tax=Triparma verrucosa TaxID=1606542 RepID=A0A9W6Z827_9STRA|nr:hypothetical protein TrVE_jg4850 [Triparma verrucosa]
MSPHETLFRLESTPTPQHLIVDTNRLSQFELIDFPGDWDEASNNPIFLGLSCFVFVLDAQDEPYDLVLSYLTNLISKATKVNPRIHVHVFINKVDGELFLSEEAKYDCRRDIVSLVQEEMETFQGLDNVNVEYYLTSIYDHSVYESFSKVVQKLVPALNTIESLLNVLVERNGMEKAFLFDVASKLYISTDSNPVDAAGYELCSDMIDVVLDVSGIYGGRHNSDSNREIDDCSKGEGEGGEQDKSVTEEEKNGYYDSESCAAIHLSNGIVLYLKEVESMLALVCLTREESFGRRGLVDYNIGVFKEAIKKMIEVAGPK